MKHCAHPGCKARHKADVRSGAAAAQEGWFTLKDGSTFCPLHCPPWVAGWRRKHGKRLRVMEPPTEEDVEITQHGDEGPAKEDSENVAWCSVYEQAKRECAAEALRGKEWTRFTRPSWRLHTNTLIGVSPS